MFVNDHGTPSRIQRYSYEALFCLVVSLGALFLLATMSTPDGMLPFGLWKSRINGYLGLHLHDDLGAYIAIILSAIVASMCILLLVRTISSSKIGNGLVHWAAGLTALIGMPVVWFIAFRKSPWFPVAINVGLWVLIELCIAASFILLLLRWTSRKRFLLFTSIFCVHCGFWLWMYTQRFGVYSAILPLVGWVAGLAWAWSFMIFPGQPNERPA